MVAHTTLRRKREGGWLGLSGRLLVLTLLFATLAEVLIYVPALSYYRRSLLNERISAAHIAALILDTSASSGLTPDAEMKVLHGVGVKFLAFEASGVRNLLADGTINPTIDRIVDLRDKSWWQLLQGTIGDLLRGSKGNIRVLGDAPGLDFVEIIMERRPLHDNLLAFSRVFLGYSLFISLMTAGLLYWVLQWMIVAPVRKLSRNVARFAENPEDTFRIIEPSGRNDEIGLTEEALAGMERSLAEELRKKRRLAELGLAVSKINHELRNILTTAQLLADRLEGVADTVVQRVAPRLVAVLDRAITFCEATLAYGRAREREPQREVFAIEEILDELEELAGSAPGSAIKIERDVPEGSLVDADREQLTRVISNLVRNSVQALAANSRDSVVKLVRITVQSSDKDTVIIVSDSGPGIPDAIRANLFKPFQSDKTAGYGGTGLGLVIAAELVAAHGGSLTLDDTVEGASFRIVIPKRPIN